jgi:hypothetical protein
MEVKASHMRESLQPVKVQQVESKEMKSNIKDRAFNHGPNTHPRNARSNQILNTREEKGNQQETP